MEYLYDYTQTVDMPNSPSTIDPKAIGNRIKMVREALNMSSADFSRLTDLSSQALSNYETGFRRPDLDQALKIVRTTGATLDWIYLGDASGLPVRIAEKFPQDARQRAAG